MSLYRRLHEVQQAPSGGNVTTHRDPVVAEMRLKIHQSKLPSRITTDQRQKMLGFT